MPTYTIYVKLVLVLSPVHEYVSNMATHIFLGFFDPTVLGTDSIQSEAGYAGSIWIYDILYEFH
jgi:hypothetical protein